MRAVNAGARWGHGVTALALTIGVAVTITFAIGALVLSGDFPTLDRGTLDERAVSVNGAIKPTGHEAALARRTVWHATTYASGHESSFEYTLAKAKSAEAERGHESSFEKTDTPRHTKSTTSLPGVDYFPTDQRFAPTAMDLFVVEAGQ